MTTKHTKTKYLKELGIDEIIYSMARKYASRHKGFVIIEVI